MRLHAHFTFYMLYAQFPRASYVHRHANALIVRTNSHALSHAHTRTHTRAVYVRTHQDEFNVDFARDSDAHASDLHIRNTMTTTHTRTVLVVFTADDVCESFRGVWSMMCLCVRVAVQKCCCYTAINTHSSTLVACLKFPQFGIRAFSEYPWGVRRCTATALPLVCG